MDVPVILSARLRTIVEFELARGNTLQRVDQPAGSSCPLALVFTLPLDLAGFQRMQPLPDGVSTWENRDRHYDVEFGYVCERTRHALAGPLA